MHLGNRRQKTPLPTLCPQPWKRMATSFHVKRPRPEPETTPCSSMTIRSVLDPQRHALGHDAHYRDAITRRMK